MTREQFVLQHRSYKRQQYRWVTIWVLVCFAMLIGNVPLNYWIDEHRAEAWLYLIYCAAWLVLIVAATVLGIAFNRRRPRKYGLLCSTCGNALTGAYGPIAIASGNCAHCGAPVFDQHDS